jgi:hypothetical protein
MNAPPLSAEEVMLRLDRVADTLKEICPTRVELREVCVFLFAASLDGLSPAEVTFHVLRVTRLLDVGVAEFLRALHLEKP